MSPCRKFLDACSSRRPALSIRTASATQNPIKDFNVSDWTDFTMSAYLLFNTSVIAVVLHNESAVLPDIQHRIQLLLGITYRKNLDYTHTTLHSGKQTDEPRASEKNVQDT